MAYEKSGEIGDSIGATIQLITGVGVAVLVLIFVGALGGQTYNLVESDIDAVGTTTLMTNDAFRALQGTAVSLDKTHLVSGTLTVFNGTNTVAGTSYIADLTAGTVTLNNTALNNTVLTANYNYDDPTVRDHVKSGIISGFSALEQTGNYLPIIVLAVVIALVLFLVLGMSNTTGNFKGGAL